MVKLLIKNKIYLAENVCGPGAQNMLGCKEAKNKPQISKTHRNLVIVSLNRPASKAQRFEFACMAKSCTGASCHTLPA